MLNSDSDVIDSDYPNNSDIFSDDLSSILEKSYSDSVFRKKQICKQQTVAQLSDSNSCTNTNTTTNTCDFNEVKSDIVAILNMVNNLVTKTNNALCNMNNKIDKLTSDLDIIAGKVTENTGRQYVDDIAKAHVDNQLDKRLDDLLETLDKHIHDIIKK